MGYVENSWEVPRWLCFARSMTLSRMVQLSVNKSSQPNGTASAVRGGMTEGCDAYRFPQNEASLVPILHNGLGSPTNRVCPPEMQLVLVTKGIMDFNLTTEISSVWLERLLWEQNVRGSNPLSPTI